MSSGRTWRASRVCTIGFKRRLGYVPEEAHVYPALSGMEYLQLMGRLRELPELADVASDLMDQGLQAYVEIDRSTASRLGIAFLTDYLLPFEIASVVLLAALIGAVVIARKEIKETSDVAL